MGEGLAGLDVDAMAARESSGILSPFKFTLRAPGPKDVLIKILYCGICHSDLHMLRNDWQISTYPLVPGHEITGVVSEVGSDVTKFKVGDHAGVGGIVGACMKCDACREELEQYCDRAVWTYNTQLPDGSYTYGGFSTAIVVDESFVVRIPDNLPLDATAPLLCAGISVYSPMKYFGMDKAGKNFGVVGLGGLGHMAVKFGKAFGMKVTVISTSPNKEKEAKELLGADFFLVSKDEEQMKKASQSLDYIVDTVSAVHPIDPLLSLLKFNGKMVLLGAPDKPLPVFAPSLIKGRKMLSGSATGSTKETQEMLDFCGEHNMTSTIEGITMEDVNKAMGRLAKSDVKYRFVIKVNA